MQSKHQYTFKKKINLLENPVKTWHGASAMAQLVEALATKPGNLSSNPEKGVSQLQQAAL